ncbi:MAG: response regulator [Magnetococcales bacterium]|nr:response regulator [Magnetococcales bacterium]
MDDLVNILIVDDSQDDAELLALDIASNGLNIHWIRVDSEIDLTTALAEQEWHVVICDVHMPALTPEQALGIAHKNGNDIPVIIVSGVVQESEAIKLFMFGAKDFFSKDNLVRLPMAIRREMIEHKSRKARLLAERRLQLRESHLRAILDNSLDAIITIDQEGLVTEFNPTAELIFGYSKEKVMGRNVADIIIPSESRSAHSKAFFSHLSQMKNKEVIKRRMEVVGECADGKKVDLEVVLVSTNKDGKINCTAFLHDISDRKQLIKSLQETLEVAESANRAKSEFLANISHEIRTPMNTIIGMTDLVLNTSLSQEEQRGNLEIVLKSADTLLELINSILDLSKIESGKLLLEEISFDLSGQIGNVCETLAIKAHEKNLELYFQVDDNIAETLVGDPLRLKQVIANLANNAIKFTKTGEIVVRVERETTSGSVTDEMAGSQDIKLHFSVSDTGIGIPKDKISRVFESFVQADGSTTREFGGTGLGLAISKHLVKMMGGELWAESEVGKGSVFHFTACFAIGHRGGAHYSRRSIPPAMGKMVVDTVLSGMRVLIADCNETSRTILRGMLVGFGAISREVATGCALVEALQEAEESHSTWDLILLDFRLLEEDPPDPVVMDGFLDYRGKVLVMLPTNIGIESYSEIGWLHRTPYLKKPVRKFKLLKAVNRMMAMEATEEKSESEIFIQAKRTTKPLKILLVEDEINNQKLATAILEHVGHDVTIANHGREALRSMEKFSYDLVLMDLQMPIMDGLETTHHIRAASSFHVKDPKVPILVLSARTLSEEEQQYIQTSMNGYLRKPYRAQELLSAVEPFARKDKIVKKPEKPKQSVIILKPTEVDPVVYKERRCAFLDHSQSHVVNVKKALDKRNQRLALRSIMWLESAAIEVGAIRVEVEAIRFRGKLEVEDWEACCNIFHRLELNVLQIVEVLTQNETQPLKPITHQP